MKYDDGRHLLWHEQSRRTLLRGRLFDLMEAERTSAAGRQSRFVLIDSPDWVNVVAPLVNKKGEECFVLVRQYRHGCGCLTLEFPGGVVDPGESLATSALREFEEETGYSARSMSLLGSINPNPAYMTNQVHTFLAHDVHISKPQQLNPDEVVDVCLLPIAEVEQKSDFLQHAIMLAALHWYRARKLAH